MAKLVSQYFDTSGSWTAPAGITRVILVGQGGGCGGAGGPNKNNASNSESGGGTTPVMQEVVVVPNTTYTVTIGAGGAGGAGGTGGGDGGDGTKGGDTTFGSLFTFYGAIRNSYSGHTSTNSAWYDGHVIVNSGVGSGRFANSGYNAQQVDTAASPSAWNGGNNGSPGYYYDDGGTGASGGIGGDGSSSGTGSAGSAGLWYGAGGGMGGAGFTAGGAGGAGYKGQLWVLWVE
jgi:hypothetical protein